MQVRKRALVALLIGVFVLPPSALFSRPAVAYDVCSDDGACIHENMADEARALYSNPEINAYWGDIHAGTGHEDELDHVFSLSWFMGALVTITHFWDADNGPDDPVENAIGSFPNGWQKVKAYWSMALGAYAKGDKNQAYHWLGHVVHHMGDNTLPTHVHDDMHWPDDDAFEEWMSLPGLVNAGLTPAERAQLLVDGPIEIPTSQPDKLYWLLYTTNQIADFFGSDDYDGDAVDPNGWIQDKLDDMAATISTPRTAAQLDNNDDDEFGFDDDNNDDGDLSVIREHSYLRGIRSIAALYQLFAETVTQVSAVVVIERVEQTEWHDWFCPIVCIETSDPDFWSRVWINGRGAQNRGDEIVDEDVVHPGWAYGHVVGTSGSIPITIEIWDHDGGGEDTATFGGEDDQSDINPGSGRGLDLMVDLAKCLTGEAGAVTGAVTGRCRESLTSTGNADDETSQVTFRIMLSKSPPVADAGGPYTTVEGTDVTLSAAGSNDPDNDITSYAWDLDGDGACDDATGLTPAFTAVGQDGSTTVKVCVTDAVGLTDDDSATVTVTNVPPSIALASNSPRPEGATTTVNGSFSDPGWLDSLTGTISWGDGTPTQSLTGTSENVRPNATLTFSATHVYGDNGIFTAQVCAADDDSTPCQSIVLTSTNVTPTTAIDMSGAVSVNGTSTFIVHAGAPLDVVGRSTDPGSDDLTLTWSWDDGTPGSSTLYLVNPPVADPAISPSVQPRDLTESKTHTYADACVYQIAFSSLDDDGSASTATANVVIVGNGTKTGLVGYWHQQFRNHILGNEKSDFDAAELACYLEIVRYMSLVFDEARPASTFADADDVLRTNGTNDARELFDQHLMAIWLSFANGTIAHDQMVDTNGDGTPDASFLEAVAAAETVRLDPAATESQVTAAKSILAKFDRSP